MQNFTFTKLNPRFLNPNAPHDGNRQAGLLGLDTVGNIAAPLTSISLGGGAVEALTIAMVDGSGNQVTSFGGGTQYVNGVANAGPTGTLALGYDGANLRAIKTASDGTLAMPTVAVTGTFWQSTQPVSIATAPVLVAGSAIIGKVGIDQTTPGTTNAMAIAQVGSTTVVAGNGVTGAGSLRVTVASDNSAIALWGHGATAGSVPANAVYGGRRGTTALPTAVTDGQQVGAMSDKFGRQVIVNNGVRDLISSITRLTLTASASETSLIAATASTFNDLLSIVVINTSATATQVDFRDSLAGTIRLSLYVPAGETRGAVFSSPVPQAAVNTAWTAQCVTSVSSIIITGQYIANK